MQSSKLVLIQNYQTKVYRWIFRQFTVHWTKISCWGHNKTKRGIPISTVYCHGIPLSGKNTMPYFKTAKQRYTGGFSASLRYIWTKISYWAHSKTLEADADIYRLQLRYTSFWQKYDCHTSKLPNKGIPVDFPPVCGTSSDNQLIKAHQNQEGGTDLPFAVTVYLFLAKNTVSLFILT